MFRKKNAEVILQIIILDVMAFLLFLGLLSNQVTYYVHPRFRIGIGISIVILLLFSLSLVSRAKQARHNVNTKHYLVFFIPILAAFLFPAAEGGRVEAVTADKSRLENTSYETSETIPYENYENEEEEIDPAIPESEEPVSSEDRYEHYADYEKDGILYISDDIFALWYNDVYEAPDRFAGKKVQYLAQVYSVDGLKENEFLAGRYFMICCAADLAGYGLICETPDRKKLKDEEWITVTGTLSSCEYDNSIIPMLTDVTIKKAEKPETEYIYYDYYY